MMIYDKSTSYSSLLRNLKWVTLSSISFYFDTSFLTNIVQLTKTDKIEENMGRVI